VLRLRPWQPTGHEQFQSCLAESVNHLKGFHSLNHGFAARLNIRRRGAFWSLSVRERPHYAQAEFVGPDLGCVRTREAVVSAQQKKRPCGLDEPRARAAFRLNQSCARPAVPPLMSRPKRKRLRRRRQPLAPDRFSSRSIDQGTNGAHKAAHTHDPREPGGQDQSPIASGHNPRGLGELLSRLVVDVHPPA
jgi:hypothetical protein